MSTMHNHAGSAVPAEEFVLQFAAFEQRLPGQFVAMHPYQPADIDIAQKSGQCVVSGHYGFELFSGNEFVVQVDGRPQTFSRYEDIPAGIDAVLKFQPGTLEHEIIFTIETTEAVKAYRVHCEPTGWVQRLQALVARERKGSACPQ